VRRLGFRRPLRPGPAPDPERRRRVPPTASLEEHIDDFVGWLIAGGFSVEEARHQGEWIRHVHRETGVNFLTLPPEDRVAFIEECDRRIDALEAEELADVDPDEPEH
jgi:hypothetical protein